MSAGEGGDGGGVAQDLVDGMPDMVDEAEGAIAAAFDEAAAATQELDRVDVADLPVDAEAMMAIESEYGEWRAYEAADGSLGWVNDDTGEYVMAATPEGVPDNYVYVAPGEDVPDDADVTESPSGGTYRSPTPGEAGSDVRAPEGPGRAAITAEDLDSPTNDELPDVDTVNVSPEQFNDSVSELLENEPKKGAFLSEHPPDELEDHTLLTTENGQGGVAVSPGGDIQNLHTHPDAPSGTGEALLREAVANGGRTLDNYDTFLTQLYARNGFREDARMDFNPEHAPDEWDYDQFGQPDVVFMSYQPDEEYESTDERVAGDEWGDAKQRSAENADRDAPAPAGGDYDGATTTAAMTDENNEYDAQADVQGMIDRAVERDGEEYVAENIDQLLAGLDVVMNVPPKEELDIPSA